MIRAALLSVAVVLTASTGALAAAPAGYDQHCRSCHQTAGTGLASQYPRLAGRAPLMAKTPEGRGYMIDTVLYGLSGRIQVEGKPIAGVMPAFGRLPDAELAAVLNQVQALGGKGGKPFTPPEIAARRATKQTPSQIRVAREGLLAKGLVP